MSVFTLAFCRRPLPALLLALLPLLAQAQLKITQATTPTTENFDGMGTASTTGTAAPLPAGFQLTATATGTPLATPVYGASTNTTATTQSTTNANQFTAGGSYNFGSGGTTATTNTDRALGFLGSSGTGAGLPRSILVAIQNTTSSPLQDLKVQFDLKQYRTNTNAYTWTFFSSPDGSTWTSQSTGDQSFAAANSAYYFPPNVFAKTATLSGLNLAAGGTVYLRWTMTGSSTSSQGIGLDNLMLTPTLGTGTPSAPAASITTTASTYASPYCLTSSAGSAAFPVAFTSSSVVAGSTYTAQLSDASGSFAAPTALGTGTSSPLSATIPAGTASGTGYRIRVVSGTTAGTDNGSNLTVTLAPATNPVTVSPSAAQTFATNASGTALTASASVPSAYAWYYSTTQGGPYNTAIAGATSASYQPKGSDFAGTGTYYLVAQATSTCGSVGGSSAPVTLTITAPPAAFTLSTTALPDFGSLAVGSTSAVKSFTVSATSLSGPLTITPPAGFEIRTGATAFACCVIQLTPDANGNVPATAIDVRFAPLAAQPYSAAVTLATPGQPAQSVAFSGTGTAPTYPAAVASTAPSAVTKTSATAGGTVLDEGGSSVTARGVVYGFEADPSLSTGAVAAGSGLGAFTAQLTGLLPDSLYYVRAYATNALGTSYGEQFTFTTLPQPLDAEPAPVSHVTASSVRSTRVLLTLSGGQPGVKHLVLARLNGPPAVKPKDATAYAASATFGQGQLLGTATYVVLSAAQDTVTVSGLHANTPYSFAVYDYQDLNGTPYAQNYLTSAADSLTLTTPALPATQLLREDFGYAGGAKLTDNGWTAHSAAGTNAVSVVSNANPYPSYAGYSDGLGNAVALKTSGEDVSRQFPAVYPRTAVYVSCVVVVSSAATAGDYFLHLGPTVLSSNFRGRVYVRQAASGNAIQFGVSGSGGTTPPIAYTTATYSLNTSYLLLLKYSFDETGNTTELYINPDPTGTAGTAYRPTATPDLSVTEGTSTSPTDIGTIALRQGSATTSPALTLDDLQVATAFPYVTPATPLPVQLTAFTAQLTAARTVRLSWQTASELHTDYFEVQRSTDGNAFSVLSRQPAAGSSATARAYQALDDAPPAGLSTVYYRLQVVDTDGTVSYSPTRTVALPTTAVGLALYPNPTRQLTTLTGAPANSPVQVLDAVGRVVLTVTADPAGTAALALPADLAVGVYVVRAGGQVTRLLLE